MPTPLVAAPDDDASARRVLTRPLQSAGLRVLISFGLRAVPMTGVCRSGGGLWATIADAVVLDYSSSGRKDLQLRLSL